MSKYRIGIVTVWIGKLPAYFPAWMKSAEHNPDIDFLIFCDQKVCPSSPNIHSFQMTMEELLALFGKKLERTVSFQDSYKLCDCKPFFGLAFEDYLRDYDFWGFCDVDLVFGNLRRFLTDDVLDRYERIYQYGHLSLFRNNEKMRHIMDLPGSIYSFEEALTGSVTVSMTEHFGLNRICVKNHIAWYTKADFADFYTRFSNFLKVGHGKANASRQIFVWDNGETFRLYERDGALCREDYVYMHWQKKRPVVDGTLTDTCFLVITAEKIIALEDRSLLEHPDFDSWNRPLSAWERRYCTVSFFLKKTGKFFRSSIPAKKIWLRQMWYRHMDKKPYA